MLISGGSKLKISKKLSVFIAITYQRTPQCYNTNFFGYVYNENQVINSLLVLGLFVYTFHPISACSLILWTPKSANQLEINFDESDKPQNSSLELLCN